MTKVLTILGPTATGKSDLAVECALKFDGEIISADSRQVYKGLDIGTGKITPSEMRGVPHHLLDIVDPAERFSAKQWKDMALKVVREISAKGKLPIICGGTGFYISSLIDGMDFPEVITDQDEQASLEKISPTELVTILETIDPNRAKNIDRNNKRRIVRAIIIARALGKVPEIKPSEKIYDTLKIGLTLPPTELRNRIYIRLKKRLESGMIDEARRLHENGLSFERMDELGLEYRYLAKLLKGELDEAGMIKELSVKIGQYAKRQMTWFKRDKEIVWMDANDVKPVFEIIERWKKVKPVSL
ncbi:MAG: tRNA (adenosine(37)-N6)-dimethylallyltransferase MiaA [Candidatus Paceibacterota bacterium]|jgi:tRNA dimethylallyltransferase